MSSKSPISTLCLHTWIAEQTCTHRLPKRSWLRFFAKISHKRIRHPTITITVRTKWYFIIFVVFNNFAFSTVVGPISVMGKLQLNMNPEYDTPAFVIPKIDLALEMQKLRVGLTSTQFQEAIKLGETMNRMQLGVRYRKYRPFNTRKWDFSKYVKLVYKLQTFNFLLCFCSL